MHSTRMKERSDAGGENGSAKCQQKRRKTMKNITEFKGKLGKCFTRQTSHQH